jgi:O-antigen/teichoic acid export membrane protein
MSSESTVTEDTAVKSRASRVLQSGIIYAAASFLASLGNSAFLVIMGRNLLQSEFGYLNASTTLANLLGAPLGIATYAVTHYIARYRASGQDAHLQGLLAGCRRFLFHLTIFGSILALVAVKPLGDFFNIPRTGLVIASVCCVLTGLWGSFATALCQGLAWFKRLALIGLLGVFLKLLFGWWTLSKYHAAEAAVLATAFMMLSNLVLLYWRRDLQFTSEEPAVSPWDRQFAGYVIVGAAYVGGSFCFQQGDLLVAQRYFSGDDLGAYSGAQKLAQSLPLLVGPLLVVLFSHRSGKHDESAAAEQFKLLGLSAFGLLGGAAGLLLLKDFGIRFVFGKAVPEAVVMVGPLALTMVFVGLLQALGTWSLASRWVRSSLLYGGLGLAYWLALLLLGKTPAMLLRVMPISTGIALAAMLVVWLTTLRGGAKKPANESP